MNGPHFSPTSNLGTHMWIDLWLISLVSIGHAAPAPMSLSWSVEATIYDAVSIHNAPFGIAIAGFRITLACTKESVTPRHETHRCVAPPGSLHLGAPNGGSLAWSSLTLEPEVWFEVRWRQDGRLQWVRPHGAEPDGLGDWVRLAVGARELQHPPSDWSETPAWRQRDPVVLTLTGSISPMASHLDWTVQPASEGFTLTGTGGGAMDPTWLAELLSEVREPVMADATDRVLLDKHGEVMERTTTLWLRPTAGGPPVGVQRVRLTSLTPPSSPAEQATTSEQAQ